MTSSVRCLQLDVGNSSAKWRLCEGQSIVSRGAYVSGDASSRQALLQSSSGVDHIWVSSVASAEAEDQLARLLRENWGVEPWFAKTQVTTAGLRNSYTDPARMGIDRWLAMLGGRARCSGDLIVIDAGSALTIDRVSAAGDHLGGYIIPGPALMERALLMDTDRVRFEEDATYALSPGVSTAEAVRHGIALAQAGAVVVALQQLDVAPEAVLFCGGAGQTLMGLLEGHTDHSFLSAPDLVFEGLQIMAASCGQS